MKKGRVGGGGRVTLLCIGVSPVHVCASYYVNIDLRHRYGISVAESQTFLLAKRPSEAMNEEKRLAFAG